MVLSKLLSIALLPLSLFAACGGSNGDLTYSCDKLGLTSLTYKGVEYLNPNAWARSMPATPGATFEGGMKPSNKYTALLSEQKNVIYFASGTPYGYSISSEYFTQRDTLTIRITIANNSAVQLNNITVIPASLQIPKPYTAMESGAKNLQGLGDSWVKTDSVQIAYFAVNFEDDWTAQRASLYTNSPDANHDTWNLGLTNVQSNGPVNLTASIAPGKSKTLGVFIRFADPTVPRSTIEIEALNYLRASSPAKLYWPDRRPIATWFLSDYGHGSALNPRGWFNDPACNCTDSAVFHARITNAVNQLLAQINGMPTHPQAVILWDVEGQEFPHVMTYVGNPPLLPVLAPEMDKEIDGVVSTLKANGYGIGVTIRPNYIPSGPLLPASCTYDANPDYNDRYLWTSGPAKSRYYLCGSGGTFQNSGGIGSQMSYKTVEGVLKEISNKVQWAIDRWGASIFYVDSVVWSGGAPFYSDMWGRLQAKFPNVLFLPEQETDRHYAYTAPYNDAAQGNFWSTASHRFLYPNAFGAINLSNTSQTQLQAGYGLLDTTGVFTISSGGRFSMPPAPTANDVVILNGQLYMVKYVQSTTQLTLINPPPAGSYSWRVPGLTDQVVQGMRDGDIYLLPGWFADWHIPAVSALWAEAKGK